MGLPGHTARGTRVTMGAVTSCTGLTNPISEGVRCMMIAGLSISPILVSKKVAEDESAPMAFPEPMVWARTLGAVSSAWRTDSVPDVPRAVLRYAWLNGTTINRKVSPVKASDRDDEALLTSGGGAERNLGHEENYQGHTGARHTLSIDL